MERERCEGGGFNGQMVNLVECAVSAQSEVVRAEAAARRRQQQQRRRRQQQQQEPSQEPRVHGAMDDVKVNVVNLEARWGRETWFNSRGET